MWFFSPRKIASKRAFLGGFGVSDGRAGSGCHSKSLGFLLGSLLMIFE